MKGHDGAWQRRLARCFFPSPLAHLAPLPPSCAVRRRSHQPKKPYLAWLIFFLLEWDTHAFSVSPSCPPASTLHARKPTPSPRLAKLNQSLKPTTTTTTTPATTTTTTTTTHSAAAATFPTRRLAHGLQQARAVLERPALRNFRGSTTLNGRQGPRRVVAAQGRGHASHHIHHRVQLFPRPAHQARHRPAPAGARATPTTAQPTHGTYHAGRHRGRAARPKERGAHPTTSPAAPQAPGPGRAHTPHLLEILDRIQGTPATAFAVAAAVGPAHAVVVVATAQLHGKGTHQGGLHHGRRGRGRRRRRRHAQLLLMLLLLAGRAGVGHGKDVAAAAATAAVVGGGRGGVRGARQEAGDLGALWRGVVWWVDG